MAKKLSAIKRYEISRKNGNIWVEPDGTTRPWGDTYGRLRQAAEAQRSKNAPKKGGKNGGGSGGH